MFHFENPVMASPAATLSPAENHERTRLHSKFTAEEDDQLRSLVEKYGDLNWSAIAEEMPGRNVRQCKERWVNYLCPTINNSEWTPEEDALLIEKQREFGSKWVRIAKFFNNRTDAMLKNRFNVLRRRERKANTRMLRNFALMQYQMLKAMPHMWQPQIVMRQVPEPVPAPIPEPEVEQEVLDVDFFSDEPWMDSIENDCGLFDLF